MNIQAKIDQLKEFQSRLDAIPAVINEIVETHKDDILRINKDQMLYGRDSAGNEFTPGYTSDPYFKTPEAAEAYARMKDRLLQMHNSWIEHHAGFPDKGQDTPNLAVTGLFQSDMFIDVSGNAHTIGSRYVDAPDIESKYNPYGLAPLSKKYFYRYFMFEVLYNHLWNGVRM